jgi:hypothetical protein
LCSDTKRKIKFCFMIYGNTPSHALTSIRGAAFLTFNCPYCTRKTNSNRQQANNKRRTEQEISGLHNSLLYISYILHDFILCESIMHCTHLCMNIVIFIYKSDFFRFCRSPFMIFQTIDFFLRTYIHMYIMKAI